MSSETKSFTVDKAIITHLITHQAGSIEKAVLELVMNSIDAGATQIHIDYTREGLTIKDNGSGFPSRQYIEDFFGVFGAPHQEGDSTFGKFRMGRGQAFAYGSSVWRSSQFEMCVDIKKNGLSYSLIENLENLEGCEITIQFYEEQKIYHYEIIHMVEYSNVDIFINGEKINETINEWTYENEHFYFKEDKNERTLEIYNQGIFVTREFDEYLSGILVSKKPFEVNFARNAIIENECEVWKSFKQYKEKRMEDEAVKGINRVIPVHMAHYYVELFFKCKIGAKQFLSLKIYRDISGKYYNIFQLLDSRFKHIVIEDKNHSSVCDSLNQMDNILVIDKYLENAIGEYDGAYTDGTTTVRELIVAQLNILGLDFVEIQIASENGKPKRSAYRKEYEKFFKRLSAYNANGIYKRERELRKSFEHYNDILALEKENPVEYVVYKKENLNVFNRDVYNIVKRMSKGIYRLMRNNTTSTTQERNILFGDSQERLQGWTDGESYIVIDMTLIDSAKKGVKEIENIAHTILHEYCHSENDIKDSAHSIDFFTMYHDAQRPHPYCNSISELVLMFIKSYVKVADKHNIRVTKKLVRLAGTF
jgi:hypothetical protein